MSKDLKNLIGPAEVLATARLAYKDMRGLPVQFTLSEMIAGAVIELKGYRDVLLAVQSFKQAAICLEATDMPAEFAGECEPNFAAWIKYMRGLERTLLPTMPRSEIVARLAEVHAIAANMAYFEARRGLTLRNLEAVRRDLLDTRTLLGGVILGLYSMHLSKKCGRGIGPEDAEVLKSITSHIKALTDVDLAACGHKLETVADLVLSRVQQTELI